MRPVKLNVEILNGRKYPAKGIGIFIIKIPKMNIIILFFSTYYMPQNSQNTISQTALKYYSQFRGFKT